MLRTIVRSGAASAACAVAALAVMLTVPEPPAAPTDAPGVIVER